MAIGRISGQMLKANLQRSGTDLAFETNLLALDVTNSRVGVGTASPATTLHVSATDALRLPSGTTAQRPGSPANGDMRYNTTTGQMEGYSGGAWASTVGEGIDNIVEDTSPQLGGSLDVNGQTIVSVSNGNIALTPHGSGEVDISKVDIDAGAIDGTIIGANSAAAVTTSALVATTADINAGTFDGIVGGTTPAAVTTTALVATTADINAGTFDGIVGGTTPAAVTTTALVATTADINAGTFDGIVGGTTPADGSFTTLSSTGATTIGGNLTVNGTTTTIDSATLTVEDPLIQLAKNNSGGAANAFDQGLFMNRGSLSNVSFLWDESADEFVCAVTGGEDGTTAGNITLDSYAGFKAGVITGGTSVDTPAIKAGDGTASATIANSTGVMTIASSVLTTADINGGTFDGVVGGTTPAAGTFTTGTITTADINGGAVDGAIIGANSAAAGTFTTGTITTADINGGAIDGTTIGAASASTAVFTTAQTSSTLKVAADSVNLSVGASDDLTLQHDGSNSAITNATGNLTITTAASSAVVFNEGSADVDFRVESNGNTHALFVDGGNDRVGIATSGPSFVLDAGGSTDAFKLPQGNTAQRPTAATGMLRFNTQTAKYEACNDGSTYIELAMAGDVPSISKVSATGDGSSTVFASFFGSAPETVNNVLVYIDNVMQEPTENYTVSSTNITFTSAPHSGARIFALTGFDNTALATSGVARTQTSSVSFTSTATVIASFNATSYRSMECFITLSDAGNTEYAVSKALVVHNGTTAFGSTYGVTNTGSTDLATITFNYNSGTVEVKALSTGGAQTALVQYSLQAV